jgi:hypothetical protein
VYGFSLMPKQIKPERVEKKNCMIDG